MKSLSVIKFKIKQEIVSCFIFSGLYMTFGARLYDFCYLIERVAFMAFVPSVKIEGRMNCLQSGCISKLKGVCHWGV